MKKLLVFGLDGVSLEIMKRYTDLHPNGLFHEIMKGGYIRNLLSTLPFFTAPAWTTFMTGLKPDINGIFHWRGRYDPLKKERPLISTHHLREATFWWYFQQYGGRVSISNFPMEYPAPPTNGRYICGTLAPENAKKVSWPDDLINEVRSKYPDYRFEIDKGISYMDKPLELWNHIYSVGKDHFDAMLTQTNPLTADLLVHVVTITDRAEHFFWHLYDNTHPSFDAKLLEIVGNPIIETLQLAEKRLENLWQTGKWENIVIVSDHGMGVSRFSFNTDVWLHQQGYLTLNENNTVAYEKSIAYSGEEPECSVYINKKTRDGFGLEDDQYVRLVREMQEKFKQVLIPGTYKKAFKDVIAGIDLYTELLGYLGPDIVFIPEEGVHPSPKVNATDIFSKSSRLYANHRREGIFMVYGNDVPRSDFSEQTEDVHIQDIFPVMCALTKIPIPKGLSGSIPADLSRHLEIEISNIWDWPKQVDGLPKFQDFSPQFIERLSELGYL